MVTIVDYRKSTNSEGQDYFSLKLQGDIEMIQSSSGSFYATAKTAFISSTFDEEGCKAMIGNKIPGSIEKEESEPYDYTIESTGEVIQLSHRYRFKPEGARTSSKPSPIKRNRLDLATLRQASNGQG